MLSHCEELGYKAAKISSDDEKEYVLKLVRESTPDNSVPQTLIGRFLFLKLCTEQFVKWLLKIFVFIINVVIG